MMSKRFLTYFLLVLMVLQSAVGVADMHQLHQAGTEHVAFDGSHQHHNGADTHNSQSVTSPDNTSSEHEWDCQHCCHCHGHCCPAILITALGVVFNKPISGESIYRVNTPQEATNPLLRPPIA